MTMDTKEARSDRMTCCGKAYRILRLLGHGKGGYSFLAECNGKQVVLKQIHHEPCAYYTFGDKIQVECRDYQRLKEAGIRIPAMLAVDIEAERIVKEFIAGQTVFDFVRDGVPVEPYLQQVREMAEQAKAAGLNLIDGDHFCTENVVTPALRRFLEGRFPEISVSVSRSHGRTVRFY